MIIETGLPNINYGCYSSTSKYGSDNFYFSEYVIKSIVIVKSFCLYNSAQYIYKDLKVPLIVIYYNFQL